MTIALKGAGHSIPTVSQLPSAEAYYPLNSSPNDASGNGLNLGGGAFTYGAGKFSDCAIDGGMLTAGSVNFTAGHPFTLAGWLKAVAFDFDGSSGTCALNVGGNDIVSITLAGGAGDGQYVLAAINAGQVSTTPGSVTMGDWNHVALVYDGSYASVFLNGYSQGRGFVGTTSLFSAYIKVAPTWGDQVTPIDDVILSLTAFTPAMIAYLWNGGFGHTYQ